MKKMNSWCSKICLGLVSIFLVVRPVAAQLSVNESGQATYSYGISIPPGIGGMQPQLALSYGGGTSNGPLGVGWTLQGVSVISRCPATKATDGQRGTVKYDASDKLCLDGQRMIQTDASGTPLPFPQSNDAQGLSSGVREYRLEKDTYTRIRAYGAVNDDTGNLNNGPKYFKVWMKSGLVFEYGVSPSAAARANSNLLIQPQGLSPAMVWPVARVSDTLGNYMDFSYEVRSLAWGTGAGGTPVTGKEWNVTQIDYTGNATVGQTPRNKVVFNWADKADGPDRSEGYHQGAKTVQMRRLSSIVSYVDSIAVRATNLAYDTGPATSRSRLTQLKECTGTGTSVCAPPVGLSYSPGGGDFTMNTGFSKNAAGVGNGLDTLQMLSATGNVGVLTGDFNGDGRTDILRWSDNPTENQLYLSEGDGNFKRATNFNITDENLFRSDAATLRSDLCFLSITTDINGDGLVDILRYASAGVDETNNNTCPAGKSSYIYLSNGDGTFNKQSIRDSSGAAIPLKRTRGSMALMLAGYFVVSNYAEFVLGDFNGDGLPDIFEFYADVGNVVIGTAKILCSSTSVVCGGRVWWGQGNGSFSGPYVSAYFQVPPSNGYKGFAPLVGGGRSAVMRDVNGDGLIDIVYPGLLISSAPNFSGSYAISTGNGEFWASGAIPQCSVNYSFGDYNGDGRLDSFCSSSNQLLIATGTAFSTQSATGLSAGSGDPIDLDGDGRSGFLIPSDTPASNSIYRSLGSGAFSAIPGTLGLGGVQLRKSDGTADYILGDFTGTGSTEILLIKANPAVTNNSLLRRTAVPVDLLASVTAPSGATSSITYTPLHNSAGRYSDDRSNASKATYPQVDMTLSMFVAKSLEADSGLGTANSTKVRTEFAYKGLKGDYLGHGTLGFREVRQQTKAANGDDVTTVTKYLQTDPYIGMPYRAETWKGALTSITGEQGGTPLTWANFTYCDMKLSTAAADAAMPLTPCPVSSKLQYPYMRESVKGGWDLNGATLPTAQITTTYNATGDPSQIISVVTGVVADVGQTYTKTTTNSYLADNTSGDNWVLGRLQRTSVSSQVANGLTAINTSVGTAPNAGSSSGTPLTPGQLAGVLSAINSLLLSD